MKTRRSFLSRKLLATFIALTSSLAAQDAWLLEMPNKMSDYLIKKSTTGDVAAVEKILERLPALVGGKAITEHELISWGTTTGKIHPQKKEEFDGHNMIVGSKYRSSAGKSKTDRKFSIKTTPDKVNFEIRTSGKLAQNWMPTFSFRTAEKTIILLERDLTSDDEHFTPKHLRQLTIDADAKGSLSWHSPESLDKKELSYESRVGLKENTSFLFGTKVFTKVAKSGDSLIRMELHSRPAADSPAAVLSHNEAIFKDMATTSGPLKKETTTITDRAVTQDGESGTWSLTVK